MLTALIAIASNQANPTKVALAKCKQFLNYAASQEDAVITYQASNMKLAIHSNASYLSKPKAYNRGHFFFTIKENDTELNNGAILNVARIIKDIMLMQLKWSLEQCLSMPSWRFLSNTP